VIDGLLPGVSQLADFGLAAPVAIFGRPSLFRVLLVESPLKYANYIVRQMPRKREVLTELVGVLTPQELHNNLIFISFEFRADSAATKISELEVQVKASPKNEALKEELEKWRRLMDTFSSTCARIDLAESHVAHISFTTPEINWEQVFAQLDTGATEIQAFVEAAPARSETLSENFQIKVSLKELTEMESVVSEVKKESDQPEEPHKSRDGDPSREEESLLSFKCLSIKQYLNDNVLPPLTEGIVEICRAKPEDPVAFLIQFLKDKQVSH